MSIASPFSFPDPIYYLQYYLSILNTRPLVKLSSDDTFIAKDVLPWLPVLLSILFLVIAISTKEYILIAMDIPLLGLLLSGQFFVFINLAEVSAFEEDYEFEIKTGRQTYRIPFSKAKNGKASLYEFDCCADLHRQENIFPIQNPKFNGERLFRNHLLYWKQSAVLNVRTKSALPVVLLAEINEPLGESKSITE